MTSIHQNVGCSPIKPSFKGTNTEVIAQTIDWLEEAKNRGYDEDSFHSLESMTEKMSDGPLKTFAKIAAIVGGAAALSKAGAAKLLQKTNSPMIKEHIMMPLTKLTNKGLQGLTKFINENPNIGKKSIKGFVMKNAKKGMEYVDIYAMRGTEKALNEIETQLTTKRNSISKAIKKAAAKAGNTLTPKQLEVEIEKRIAAGKSKAAIEYKTLLEQKNLIGTDNLIKKLTSNTAAVAGGTTAVIGANRDKDGDGIADIGQHKISVSE